MLNSFQPIKFIIISNLFIKASRWNIGAYWFAQAVREKGINSILCYVSHKVLWNRPFTNIWNGNGIIHCLFPSNLSRHDSSGKGTILSDLFRLQIWDLNKNRKYFQGLPSVLKAWSDNWAELRNTNTLFRKILTSKKVVDVSFHLPEGNVSIDCTDNKRHCLP